jgi:AcrR family transcriptional regulator
MVKPARRRRLAPAERRLLIVEAAGRLFGQHGFDATRLEDVAAEAEITKPILYRHFDSKKSLYLALLEQHRDDLATFTESMPSEGQPRERLRAVIELWLSYVEDHAYAWKMLFCDTGGGPEIRAFRVEVNARARAVLVGVIHSMSQRPIPRRELEPLAEFMSMGMASLVLWWIENPGIRRAAIVDAILRVWAGLLLEEQ